MQRKELVAEIARELGVSEEVVERAIYALLERFGEGPPVLTAQLVSELRGLAHQLGRLEGEFGEFRRGAEPRLEQIAELAQRVQRLEGEFSEFRRGAEPRLEQITELAQRVQRLEGEFGEFRRSVEPRLEQIAELSQRVEGLRGEFLGLRAEFLEFKEAVNRRLDRLERWLFAFLVPILLALLSLVIKVFLFGS